MCKSEQYFKSYDTCALLSAFSKKVTCMSQLCTATCSVLLSQPIGAENIFRETGLLGLLNTCLVLFNNH